MRTGWLPGRSLPPGRAGGYLRRYGELSGTGHRRQQGDRQGDRALAPGLRRTDLNAAAASDGDPAEAAAGAVRLALLPDDGPSGEFFSWDGTLVPW